MTMKRPDFGAPTNLSNVRRIRELLANQLKLLTLFLGGRQTPPYAGLTWCEARCEPPRALRSSCVLVGFGFPGEAPELESLRSDCLLERQPGNVVRRRTRRCTQAREAAMGLRDKAKWPG
jgi:hypothetical protein